MSMEEALKKMEEWVKKKIKSQPITSLTRSPLSSPSGWVEKRKEFEPSVKHQNEKRARRKPINVDVEPLSVSFLLKTSLWKNLDAFALVFPQLVLEEDQPIYERLGEINIF